MGSNLGDYSPESAPTCCESADAARTALLDKLARTRDVLPECNHEATVPECPARTWYAEIDSLITKLAITDPSEGGYVDVSEGYSVDVNTGRSRPLTHWVGRFDAGDLDNHAECNPED
ncbi:hypothetical protein [Kutzneria sp. 744]|uniref:hypothetical protein n=1 Tax=Kutzneria sp. (strain 744) TaxID=345341 RepID=UPI0018DC2D1B|nr:hypothetical protein [Kutzneria sp. 744]